MYFTNQRDMPGKSSNTMVRIVSLTKNGVMHGSRDFERYDFSLINQCQAPITLTIKSDGALFVGDKEIPFAALKPRLEAMASGGYDKPIYVRADGKASYEVVARVMAALSTGGFSKINLITDTGGPSSGATTAAPSEPPAK